MNQFPEALSFADVLIRPKYSRITSRSKVDLSVKIKEWTFKHCFIPANMKDITGEGMLVSIVHSQGLGLLHRFMKIEEQIEIFNRVRDIMDDGYNINALKYMGASIGVQPEDKDNVKKLYDIGIRIFCIDVAHGEHKLCVDMCKWIKDKYTDILLIAGNIATGTGAVLLWEAGADVCKVGVGSGSICSTRVKTGCGVPQFTAVVEVAFAKGIFEADYPDMDIYFISDGGIREPGDCGKALCYADMVMIGNLFAGSVSCPGSILNINGREYKEYSGSSTYKNNRIEGVSGFVKTKGEYAEILQDLKESLQSTCAYNGVDNLQKLKVSPQFMRITNAGIIESQAHDLDIIKE